MLDNAVMLSPTGDAETDTKNFAKVISAVPKKGGVIVIADNGKSLKLDSRIKRGEYILKPITIRGETRNSRIEKSEQYFIHYGAYQNPQNVKPNTLANSALNGLDVWAFEGLDRLASSFKFNGCEIKQGDWLTLISDDDIQGLVPHLGRYQARPLEMHRVAYVKDGMVVLSTPVKERMRVNPRLQKMSPLRNCGIYDLTLGSTVKTAGSQITTSTLMLDQVVGFRMYNCTVDETGFGYTLLKRGADVDFAGYSGMSQPNPDRDYALVVVTGNNVTWRDSVWHECRHVFTTGGFQDSKHNRYAGTTSLEIRNVTANIAGDVYGNPFCVFDTHPECDPTFRNCTVNASSPSSADQVIGYNFRSKNTKMFGCAFNGNRNNAAANNANTAVKLEGSGAVVDGCRFENAWVGLSLHPGTRHGGHEISNNAFVNCSTVGIRSEQRADAMRITNNRFLRSGYFDNVARPRIPKVLMMVHGGTGHVIRGNEIDRDGNEHAFDFGPLKKEDVTIEGNYARGYGAGRLGVMNSTPTGATINARWAGKNYTD